MCYILSSPTSQRKISFKREPTRCRSRRALKSTEALESTASRHYRNMDFTLLPDEVLLAVLAHLPTRAVFSSRLVCRRFRDLCLHRYVWQDRELELGVFGGPRTGLVRATLSLAPCLRSLTLHGEDLTSSAALMSSTKCAVSKLVIGNFMSDVDISLDLINIVDKFASLGGLKELGLGLSHDPDSPLEPILLKSIYTLKGLKHLNMTCNTPLTCDASFGVEVAPSLIALTFRSSGHGSYSSNPFVELMLRTHAATLETVILELNHVPMPLLVAIPNLRSVSCYPQQDLPCLLDCPNLSDFELMNNYITTAFPPGTLDFLNKACNLRKVNTYLPKEDASRVILALAGSPSAAGLEALDLYTTKDEEQSALASVLHKFSSLQKLDMAHPLSKDLLRTISPVTTPCLTVFKTNAYGSVDPCYHSWLHGPAVQDLLARNPRLHLQLDFNGFLIDCEDCSCEWCAWGCHADLRRGYIPETGFSAHSEDECDEWIVCEQIAHSPSIW